MIHPSVTVQLRHYYNIAHKLSNEHGIECGRELLPSMFGAIMDSDIQRLQKVFKQFKEIETIYILHENVK